MFADGAFSRLIRDVSAETVPVRVMKMHTFVEHVLHVYGNKKCLTVFMLQQNIFLFYITILLYYHFSRYRWPILQPAVMVV